MNVLKVLDPNRYRYLHKGWFLSYYYKLTGSHPDVVSRYLLDFKNEEEPITSKWIEIATSCFTIKHNFDLIVRVLSSEETHANDNTPIHRLGKEISKKIDVKFSCDCLYKSRPTQQLKKLNQAQRFEEINNVYRFKSPNIRPQKILLLDDIVTSGTTIIEIKRAIRTEIGPFNLCLFVLGKTFDNWYDTDENKDLNNEEIKKLLEN